jgi:hypothetical protein
MRHQLIIPVVVLLTTTGVFAQRVLNIGGTNSTVPIKSTGVVVPAETAVKSSPQTPPPTNAASHNSFEMRPGEIVGSQQIMRISIPYGTNEFVFEQPESTRIIQRSGFALALAGKDDAYSISVRILNSLTNGAELKAELHKSALETYPTAENIEEFNLVTLAQDVPAIQLRQRLPGVPTRVARMVWVPFNNGILEITFNSDVKTVSSAEQNMAFIFVTLRSNEHGQIVVPVRAETN